MIGIPLNVLNLFVNMDYVTLVYFVAFLLLCYMTDKTIILKYLFMYVMFSYHVLSVFIVENFTIYFKNLLESSYHTGCFLPLVNFYMIYFGFIFLFEEGKNKRYKIEYTNADVSKVPQKAKTKIKIVSTVLILVLAVVLFSKRNIGFYSFGGLDRFDYTALTYSFFDQKFYSWIPWLLPLPLMGKKFGYKKISILYMILYCFYLIWVGDKFGSLFIAFYIYILVTWMSDKLDNAKLKKMMTVALAAVILLMIFISFQVKYQWGDWSDVPIYFAHRLTGGQSDLWWKIYNMSSTNQWFNWRFSEFFRDEVTALFYEPEKVVDYYFGIYKMMRITAPDSIVNAYLARGIRFASSTQASLYYYFDYFGLYLGAYILARFGYWIVNKSMDAYKNTNIIEAIFCTMILTKYIGIMQMSEFRYLGNSTTIIAFLYFAYQSVKRKRVKIR